MASLKQIVREEYDTFVDGIAWVVIYKDGRSWKSNTFYETGGSYNDGLIFGADDMIDMRIIASIDHKAICVNGYYMALDTCTREELEDKLLWMYNERLNLLQVDFLGGLVKEEE